VSQHAPLTPDASKSKPPAVLAAGSATLNPISPPTELPTPALTGPASEDAGEGA
jgi:hypothetical protein